MALHLFSGIGRSEPTLQGTKISAVLENAKPVRGEVANSNSCEEIIKEKMVTKTISRIMLGCALYAFLGLAMTAKADTVTIVGNSTGSLATATVNCTFNWY